MFEIDLNSPEYLSLFIEEITEIVDRLERQLLDYENNKDEEINKGIKRDFHTLKGDFMTYGKTEYADFFHNLETIWKNPESRKENLISKVLEEITKIKKEFGMYGQGEDGIEEVIKKSKTQCEVKEEMSSYEQKYYEIILDFKGEKIKEFEEEEVKGLCNIEGKLLDYSHINSNIPDFSEFDPEKIYLKIRMVISTEDIDIIKNGIAEIIDLKYIQVNEGGQELLEKKHEEKKGNVIKIEVKDKSNQTDDFMKIEKESENTAVSEIKENKS